VSTDTLDQIPDPVDPGQDQGQETEAVAGFEAKARPRVFRRRHARYQLPKDSPLPARLLMDDTEMVGLLLDVTREGFSFVSRQPLPDLWLPGHSLESEFLAGSVVVAVSATIRYLNVTSTNQSMLRVQYDPAAVSDELWLDIKRYLVHRAHAGAIWLPLEGNTVYIYGYMLEVMGEEIETLTASGEVKHLDIGHCVGIEPEAMKAFNKVIDHFGIALPPHLEDFL